MSPSLARHWASPAPENFTAKTQSCDQRLSATNDFFVWQKQGRWWQDLLYYICLFKTCSPKTKVCSPNYVQSPKSESETKVWICQLSKTETEVHNAQNLKFGVESLKSEVKSIWSPFKVFCNYYNFVIQYRYMYYILCVCRSIITIAGQLYG